MEFIAKQTLFYEQILKAWFSFYSVNPDKRLICDERLWNNKFILIEKHPINNIYKRWREHDIEYIKNIIHEDGTF